MNTQLLKIDIFLSTLLSKYAVHTHTRYFFCVLTYAWNKIFSLNFYLLNLALRIIIHGLVIYFQILKFDYFLQGEAQKIEYLTRIFTHYYYESNTEDYVRLFKSAKETIEVLSYAIIMLNTLIHNRNIKPSDRMSFAKFLMQTKGIDNDQDIDRDYLHAIYERVRSNEFKANAE